MEIETIYRDRPGHGHTCALSCARVEPAFYGHDAEGGGSALESYKPFPTKSSPSLTTRDVSRIGVARSYSDFKHRHWPQVQSLHAIEAAGLLAKLSIIRLIARGSTRCRLVDYLSSGSVPTDHSLPFCKVLAAWFELKKSNRAQNVFYD